MEHIVNPINDLEIDIKFLEFIYSFLKEVAVKCYDKGFLLQAPFSLDFRDDWMASGCDVQWHPLWGNGEYGCIPELCFIRDEYRCLGGKILKRYLGTPPTFELMMETKGGSVDEIVALFEKLNELDEDIKNEIEEGEID